MNRLTKKIDTLKYVPTPEKFISINKLIYKLGKLEDLEEELGCPLEVMFEALKKGIRINKTRYTPISLEYFGIVSRDEDKREFKIAYGSDYDIVKPKDYQKTWWLPKERIKENE